MQPTPANQAEPGTPVQSDGGEAAGQDSPMLARVKAVARGITERVQKVLGDTGDHAALPTEEHPPLA